MNAKISRSLLYSRICIALLCTLSLTGLIAFGGRNLLPATLIFELFVFGSCLAFLGSVNRRLLFPVVALAGYVILSYAYAVGYRGAHSLDFLLIYKSFIYLLFLSFLAGKCILRKSAVRTLNRIFLAAFFLKYAYSVALGLNMRPYVFAENNFELMFLALVFYLKFSLYSRATAVEMVLLIGTFALSGSRSGIVILLFLLLMIYLGRISFKRLLGGAVLACLAGILVVVIFSSRASSRGLEGVDRYVFLLMFLHDIDGWGLFQYLFGLEPITPMSEHVCARLGFYKNLFSFSDNGVCYSNVLHSYVLRAIFDHGLVGFASIVGASVLTLKVSGFPKKDIIAFVGIVLLNSASVSAFNSVYFAAGFALAIASGKQVAGKPNFATVGHRADDLQKKLELRGAFK